MKFVSSVILSLVLTAAVCPAQNVPDTPQPQSPEVSTPTHQAGFFTFRKGPNYPPLRTNKQVFHSKTFLILNGAFAASVIVDVEYTHGKRESRGSEYPVIPALIGLDYIMDRFFTRAFSVEAPIYGIQHYVRDAFKGK